MDPAKSTDASLAARDSLGTRRRVGGTDEGAADNGARLARCASAGTGAKDGTRVAPPRVVGAGERRLRKERQPIGTGQEGRVGVGRAAGAVA